uniref:Reverse transcriptase domain-containing protein n=1 Tax=Hordeum vulgare subsp. vulgare TaxID=112509 RepID=A0A8I6XZ81_HORVV
MQSLAMALTGWGSSSFGFVRTNLRQLRARLCELRENPHRIAASYEEVKVEGRIVELWFREEIMWRQRAQIQWLLEGDQNTKFFHQKASSRRKKNNIVSLTKADGSICSDPRELENIGIAFYENLYTSEGVIGMEEVLSHIPCKVTSPMNEMLSRDITEGEVKRALFQMYPTKAPGPDGFPAHFFQKYWHLCGDEVTEVVIRILKGEDSPEEINRTFIVIIPEVQNPTLLSQYRPISLCNVLFKIASKVLANRLKQILPEIISEEQSAFVPGRLITDNVITAYECLHFIKSNRSKKNGHCAVKLDMMKAYDRVEWAYLQAIMRKLGFCESFVRQVMRGVTSVSFSLMFNGKQTRDFKPTRGIRQGDPISPYLFLLAAEGLSCLLNQASNAGTFEGIHIAPTAPKVNHLLFADDSLLFCKNTAHNAEKLREILNRYCQASGQRVNYDKSSVYFGKGCPGSQRETIKGILQIQKETICERYLGLPSDVGQAKNGVFSYLKDSVWKNIQGWMEKCLAGSGKGRQTMMVISHY